MSERGSSQLLTEIESQRDALLSRFGEALIGTLEVYSIYLGDRLGYYVALTNGPANSSELAFRTGTNERYCREWLEQQTVAGLLSVDDPALPGMERRYSIPAGHFEALTDRNSLNYLPSQPQLFVGALRPIDALIDAFRTGGGIRFDDYGEDVREGLSSGSRLLYQQMIGTEWLPAMPDVHARLQGDPPARVADLGCGAGWLCIGIAQAYPGVMVDGYDLDEASVELAKRNVAEAGLSDRVTISCRDAGDAELSGQYDLVTAFICIHDMSRPVEALKTMRSLTGPRGTALVCDLKSGERFLDEKNNREVERLYYGFSIFHCLPAGMAEQPSAETGSIMRPDVFRGYAASAGFSGVDILPIDDEYQAFYRLRP